MPRIVAVRERITPLKGYITLWKFPALLPRAVIDQASEEQRNALCVCRVDCSNLVTTIGHELLLGFWANQSPGILVGAQYIAVGTSTTAPASGDTQLGAEAGRVSVTSGAPTSTNVIISAFFDISQANVTWQEVGIIGSNATYTATTSANTGALMTHALFGTPVAKTSAYQVLVNYSCTFS